MPGTCAYLFVFLLLTPPILPQKTPTPKKDPSQELWLARSQTLTEELVKDGADLEPLQRSIMLARLAQLWWRENPTKAKSWMAAAITSVEAIPNKENPEDRRKRISTARQVLQIVAPLDQELSSRLVELLKEVDKSIDTDERSANAQGLLDAALSLVDSDPVRASELGAVALSINHSCNIDGLILLLRQKDVRLADTLLAQGLALARLDLEPQLLMNLTRATFPAEMQIVTSVPPPAETLRAELLQLDLVYLQANPINKDAQNSVCAGVVSFVLPVFAEFDRYFPQQASAVRQAVNQCQSLSPLSQQRIDEALGSTPLNTVEDLLKAAEDAQDLKVRTEYLFRAASLAKGKRDYERALTILDRMTADERAFMGKMWQYSRWDWSSLAAVDHYNHDDFSAMRNTIKAVPDDLKAFAKLAFIDRLPKKRNEDADPTLEFLVEARKELASSYGSEEDRCAWYFTLLGLTLLYASQDSPAILKEAVAALNRADKANDKRDANDRAVSSSRGNLPPSLIDMDAYAVKEAVASINSTWTRVGFRLELLQASIERLRSAEQNGPAKRRPAAGNN